MNSLDAPQKRAHPYLTPIREGNPSMRKALFALPLLASALILPRTAHADTISFIVSLIGSGNIGAETFTNDRVTFTASSPEQQILDDFAASGDNPSSFATCAISSASVTVQNVGTFESYAGANLGTCVEHNFTSNNTYGMFDSNLGLGVSVPLAFDSFQSSVGPSPGIAGSDFDQCDPDTGYPCPPAYGTSGGNLTFTSIEPDSGIAELLITADTPEPSTIVLLATGLLGAGCLFRRERLAR